MQLLLFVLGCKNLSRRERTLPSHLGSNLSNGFMYDDEILDAGTDHDNDVDTIHDVADDDN